MANERDEPTGSRREEGREREEEEGAWWRGSDRGYVEMGLKGTGEEGRGGRKEGKVKRKEEKRDVTEKHTKEEREGRGREAMSQIAS